jgi:hypothetical protein
MAGVRGRSGRPRKTRSDGYERDQSGHYRKPTTKVGISNFAVLTYQEIADILFERGILPSPNKSSVQWYEQSAFRKIRKAFPELAVEIEESKGMKL